MPLRPLLRALQRDWQYADTRSVTYISMLSGYLWTIGLLLPGQLFDRPAMVHMATIMGAWPWAILFSSLSSLQLWRIYVSANRLSNPLEYATKMAAVLVWTFVASACLLSRYPPPLLVADTLVIMLATWWDFLRHGRSRTLVRGEA